MCLLRSQGIDVDAAAVADLVDRADHYEALLQRKFELEGELGPLSMLPGFGIPADREARLRAYLGRLSHDVEEIDHELGAAEQIIIALNELARLTHLSSKYRVPTLWSCPQAYSDAQAPALSADELCVAGLYLRGLRSVAVTSLAGALQLVTHEAVEEFREEVRTMCVRMRMSRSPWNLATAIL